MKQYVEKKKKSIFNDDKVISILGLVDNNNLIGFISLFKYDGEHGMQQCMLRESIEIGDIQNY